MIFSEKYSNSIQSICHVMDFGQIDRGEESTYSNYLYTIRATSFCSFIQCFGLVEYLHKLTQIDEISSSITM